MQLSAEDLDRIIMMAWEDRTPFEAIEAQFGLSEHETKQLLRRHLTDKTYRRWRRRVNGRKTKHAKLRRSDVKRFKSASQQS